MLRLRVEYAEEEDVKVGQIYDAQVNRGFIVRGDENQFSRSIDPFKDFGRLVLFVDLCVDDKIVTTFCYNTLEFNERFTIIRDGNDKLK